MAAKGRAFLECAGGRWKYTAGSAGFEGAAVVAEVDGHGRDCLDAAAEVRRESGGDIHGTFEMLGTRSRFVGLDMTAEVRFRAYGDFLLADLRLTNHGDVPRRLDRCRFLGGGAPIRWEGEPAGMRVLCQSGWTNPNRVLDAEGDGQCLGKTLGLAFDPASSRSVLCGFLSFDRANTEIQYRWRDNEVAVDAGCDFDGYELAPGRSIDSETFYLEVSDDPLSSLERWAGRVAAHYRPDFRSRPSIGWVAGWTWRDFFGQETYEEMVLDNVDAIERRLPGFGIEHVWMSVGNLRDMMPSRWLEQNTEGFPHGWEHTIDRIRRQGMKPGFWVAPFWIPDSMCDTLEEHRDHLLKKDGRYVRNDVRWGYGPSLGLPPEERPGFYSLDGSHPGARAYWAHVFSRYREMGIRYYMIDFLYSGSGSTPGEFPYDEYHDRTLVKGPEVYRAALRAIREAAGPDAYILSSTGPTFQNVGLADAVRSGPDFGEGRPLHPRFGEYPGTYKIGNRNMLRHAAANYATTYFTGRKLYHNDVFNVLTVDQPIPLPEARTAATLLALSGGPVMLGDDIASMAEDRLSIVKKCIPPFEGSARPVDLMTCSEPAHCLFHLPVDRSWDRWSLAGMINLDDQTRKRRVCFDELGLPAGEYRVYDFWNERYLGRFAGSFDAEIPPGGASLYRIARTRPHPWLLSTDMHITQGGVEVVRLSWDARTRLLEGVCVRPRGEVGSLFIHLPDRWRPLDYKGLHVAKISGTGECILRMPLHFTRETVSWTLAFTRDGEDEAPEPEKTDKEPGRNHE